MAVSGVHGSVRIAVFCIKRALRVMFMITFPKLKAQELKCKESIKQDVYLVQCKLQRLACLVFPKARGVSS